MDIRQLKYFYTIAEEGQITLASKKLHIAQPPLSQALKKLETEIGVPLFERNGRKMELTEAGRVLYSRADTLFKHFDETIREVQETAAGVKGELSIGCVKSSFSHIPPIIRWFNTHYPEVTFNIRDGDSYLLQELLKHREIDLALVRLPIDLEHVNMLPLKKERYVAILNAELARTVDGDRLTLEQLSTMPLVLLRRLSGTGQYEFLLQAFKERGTSINVLAVCPDVDMLMEMVAQGVGASIVPEAALNKRNASKVYRYDIDDEQLISESAIIWLKNHYLSKTARRFLERFDTDSMKMRI